MKWCLNLSGSLVKRTHSGSPVNSLSFSAPVFLHHNAEPRWAPCLAFFFSLSVGLSGQRAAGWDHLTLTCKEPGQSGGNGPGECCFGVFFLLKEVLTVPLPFMLITWDRNRTKEFNPYIWVRASWELLLCFRATGSLTQNLTTKCKPLLFLFILMSSPLCSTFSAKWLYSPLSSLSLLTPFSLNPN